MMFNNVRLVDWQGPKGEAGTAGPLGPKGDQV